LTPAKSYAKGKAGHSDEGNESKRRHLIMGVATAVLQKTKASVPVKTIAPESLRDQVQNVFDAVSRRAY